MTGPTEQAAERTRLLSELIADDAPMALSRAASIMASVSRQLLGDRPQVTESDALSADRVLMHEDGTVTLVEDQPLTTPVPAWAEVVPASAPPTDPTVPGATDVEAHTTGSLPSLAGASIGRLLFALLIGRAPLDRSDAHEPAITEALGAGDTALLARSCSDAQGQWPSVDEWTPVLTRLAGGAATPLSPGERRRNTVRTVLLTLGVVLLAAITVTVLLLAPAWWDDANEQSQTTAPTPATRTTTGG